MIKVKEYRGHIRNWEELCERLEISLDLTREEREEQILVKAYETWGNEMADHMHGMFAFALWDEEEQTPSARRKCCCNSRSSARCMRRRSTVL